MVERFEVARRRGVAGLGQMADPHPVRGDEGHLGRREQRRHKDRQHDGPYVDHAARLPPERRVSFTSTSTTRVRWPFSTATLTSPIWAFSPLWGTRPKRSSTQPPTVSKDSLGRRRPVAALSSSMGSLPETR